MVVTARTTGRWAGLVSAAGRKRLALAISPALALLAMVVAPALPAEAAFSCSYSNSSAQTTVHDPGGTFTLAGKEFAGHYSGNTVIPTTGSISEAGKEAQCLLKRAGFNPGTIDGIFGPNSQSAARGLQNFVNNNFHAGISVDGLPGPQTWPWLRFLSQGV
jgi:peptidoglycan hydrolase-like protein with peptidoglycan-binding domain